MTILELENLTGLDRATIRYYEKEGLISPDRKENSYRDYSETDLQEILRIKLLRQFDLPLQQIKSLQQGSADISSVLRQQGTILAKRAVHTEHTAKICMEISEAAVTYHSLDALHYLEVIKEAEQTADSPSVVSSRPTQSYREYHPIRRYVARVTDYAILQILIRFLLIVVLRIRPLDDWMTNLISYGIPFLCLPLHALSLSRFGTTPGKWMMGIRIHALNGSRLTFDAALQREWNTLRYGLGFGIPIWSIWRQIKSYMEYKDYLILDHDRYVDYYYTYWKPLKKSVFAAVCTVLVALTCINAADIMKPRYRGDDLTVVQFAENYNYYAQILDYDYAMNPDGTWYVRQAQYSGEVIILNEPLVFETEGDRVKRITYENSWSDVVRLQPLNSKLLTAMVTAVFSQKGVGIGELKEFLKQIQDYVADTDVNIQYENIEINWTIETTNCINSFGKFYTDDQNKPSKVSLTLEILIHEVD